MQRGQAPQRPPNLAPGQTQGMGNVFRNQFNPTPFLMGPPRTVSGVLGYPQPVPNHHPQAQQQQRSQQQPGTLLSGPSPGGIFAQRSAATGGFPFGVTMLQQPSMQQPNPSQSQSGSMPPHLQHPQPQQHQQQPQPPAPPLQSQQQQQLSPQQAHNSSSNSNNPPQSSNATSDVSFDPSDFPALGSGANGNGTGSSTNGTGTGNGSGTPLTPATLPSSYASQAGVGVPLTSGATGGAPGLTSGNAPGPIGQGSSRDFGPEDFPALGGPLSSNQTQENHNGVNGFTAPTEGSRTSGNVVMSSRTTGFGSDTDARKFPLKGSAQNMSWSSSPALNPNTAAAGVTNSQPFSQTLTNGNSSNHPPQQPNQPQPPQPSSIGGPPGVPPLTLNLFNHAATIADSTNTGQGNGNGTGIPQTPAQQVLMSPADRWGLLGLLAMIRSSDPETALLGIGTDLGTMGLDMQNQGSLYSTFITPWSDSSAAHLVEPDFHLPACYGVNPSPLTPNKVAAFSDETLFFMFYAHPRDTLQELSAQELWNRNWRFHKEMRVWLTKETGTSPSQKQAGGETGIFTIWDSENWEKTRKRMHVSYADLEEKTNAVFTGNMAVGTQVPGQPGQQGQPGGQGPSTQTQASVAANSVPTQQQPQQQRDTGLPTQSRFAGMGQGMSVGA